jgi:hypothetical protein
VHIESPLNGDMTSWKVTSHGIERLLAMFQRFRVSGCAMTVHHVAVGRLQARTHACVIARVLTRGVESPANDDNDVDDDDDGDDDDTPADADPSVILSRIRGCVCKCSSCISPAHACRGTVVLDVDMTLVPLATAPAHATTPTSPREHARVS